MLYLKQSFSLMFTYLLNTAQEIGQATVWASILSLPTVLLSLLTDWTLENTDYVRVVLVAIAVDHLLGTFVHLFIKRDFNILKNLSGIGLKLFIIIGVGLLFEGLSTLIVAHDFVYAYLITVLHLGVFLYPAKSAMLNSHIITKGVFPPKILVQKISTFTDTFDMKDLDFNKENK